MFRTISSTFMRTGSQICKAQKQTSAGFSTSAGLLQNNDEAGKAPTSEKSLNSVTLLVNEDF